MKINPRTVLLVLAAAATLTGCTHPDEAPTSSSSTSAPASPRTLPLELPVVPAAPEPTGTDAGLITEPAPGIPEPTATPARPASPARPVERPRVAPAAPAQPAPPDPAAAVVPGAPMDNGGPTDDSDCFREDAECYGEPVTEQPQLPEEVIGGYRCGDDVHVVVRIDPDGTLVCGLPAEIGQ